MSNDTATTEKMQNVFMDYVHAECKKYLATLEIKSFIPATLAQGFNYKILDSIPSKKEYNPASMKVINSGIGKNEDGSWVITEGSFTNMYSNIIELVHYYISQADQKIMDNESALLKALESEIEDSYDKIGGEIPVPGTLPINMRLSIKIQAYYLEKYPNLRNMPDYYGNLKKVLLEYQVKAVETNKLLEAASSANGRLKCLIENIQKPTEDNGGQKLSSGNYMAAYSPETLPTYEALAKSVLSTDRNISIECEAKNFISDSVEVNMNKKISYGKGNLFFSFGVRGSSQKSISEYTSQSSVVSIKIEYSGLTSVGSSPTNFEQSKGWYDHELLKELAVHKTDESGLRFINDHNKNADKYFGKDKPQALARLKNLIICKQPKITVLMTNINIKKFEEDIKSNESVSFNLFGFISIGGGSSSTHSHRIEKEESKNEIKIIIEPQAIHDDTAFILGGEPVFPPLIN